MNTPIPSDPERQKDSVEARVQALQRGTRFAAVIGRCDDELSQVLLNEQNEASMKAGLSGLPILIHGENITWQQEKFNMQTGEEDIDLYHDLPSSGNFAVRFLDYASIDTEGGRVLLYRFEHPKGSNSSDVFITGYSAVTQTTVQVLPEQSDSSEYADKQVESIDRAFISRIDDLFDELQSINDEEFQNDLSLFLDIYHDDELPYVDVFNQIGVLLTKLMTYDYILENEEARQTLLTMIASMVDGRKQRFIDGDFIKNHKLSSKKLDPVSYQGMRCFVRGAAFVPDYETALGKDAELNPEGGWQPAFRVFDEENNEYYVPLRYVRYFNIVSNATRHKLGCYGARERFLTQNDLPNAVVA